MNGFLREMLGVGDIEIAFDRPNNKIFYISNVTHARQIGSLLTELLMTTSSPHEPSYSYRDDKNTREHTLYRLDSIFPKQAI